MEVVFEGTPTESGAMRWVDAPSVSHYLKSMAGHTLVFNVKEATRLSDKERMYNYYHKAILPAMMEVLTRAGWIADKVIADYELKAVCAKDIYYNEKTGEQKIALIDKSSMNKSRLLKYINDCIMFLETEYGMTILSGQEWKELYQSHGH